MQQQSHPMTQVAAATKTCPRAVSSLVESASKQEKIETIKFTGIKR